MRSRPRHARGRSALRRGPAIQRHEPGRDQECFCDGIAEELSNALTQIPGLRVAARTSAFQFKGQARDARQIGHVLNVGTVLDGSVRKHNNRLRITVELIGTGDGYQLWSERFDRDMEDVFAVQDEIAASVVKTLKGQLTARKYRSWRRTPGTSTPIRPISKAAITGTSGPKTSCDERRVLQGARSPGSGLRRRLCRHGRRGT